MSNRTGLILAAVWVGVVLHLSLRLYAANMLVAAVTREAQTWEDRAHTLQRKVDKLNTKKESAPRTTDPMPRRTDMRQHCFMEGGKIWYRTGMVIRDEKSFRLWEARQR